MLGQDLERGKQEVDHVDGSETLGVVATTLHWTGIKMRQNYGIQTKSWQNLAVLTCGLGDLSIWERLQQSTQGCHGKKT
jgi:hypothetical protein